MAVITISRQFGSGARKLGNLIADKLGYTVVDEDVIQKVAEKAKVSEDWVHSIEQEAGGKILKFITSLISKNYIDRLVGDDRGYIDEDVYVNALNDVISKIAEQDNVIIIGRGGQYILENYPDVFHLLLVAKEEDRIRFVAKRSSLSINDASKIVEEQGRRRLNFYKKFHHQDFDRPEHYHVVLNMSRMDMEKASEFVYRMVADVVCEIMEK